MADEASRQGAGRRPGWFARFASEVSRVSGRPIVFAVAVALVLAWAISGPAFGFSSTWQLVINTGTTIITFLMVFLIQATQNRDNVALQLKLDELIEATRAAHEDMIDLEHQPDDVIEEKRQRLLDLRRAAEESNVTAKNGQ